MSRTVPAFAIAALASAVALAGCVSSSSPQEEAASCDTSSISFQSGVLPILEQSCGLAGACHGDPHGKHVFLGSRKVDSGGNAGVYANLVNRPASVEGLVFVMPGDPARSFLQQKIDWDFSAQPQCKDGACGANMPLDAVQMDACSRAKIRAWIADGAPDD